LSSETGGSEGTEQGSTYEATRPVQNAEVGGPEVSGPPGPQPVEGRRTQLRIVRENIQSLSNDVGNFRKRHEVTTKRLDKQLATLRSELAAHTRSKDVGNLSKDYKASARRLEKQVATLRSDLSALKGGIAKDAARSRAKQEAILAKILAKVSVKRAKPAKRAKKR
jgi:hypothetical protein